MHNELIIIIIFGDHYYDSKSPHLQPPFKTLYLYALTNIKLTVRHSLVRDSKTKQYHETGFKLCCQSKPKDKTALSQKLLGEIKLSR